MLELPWLVVVIYPLVIDESPYASHCGSLFNPREFHPGCARFITDWKSATLCSPRPRTQHSLAYLPTSTKPRWLGLLSPCCSFLMSRDEECSESCGCSHCQRDICSDELPVCLPNCVKRCVAGACANPSNSGDRAHDGQDGQAEGRCENELLWPSDLYSPYEVERDD